MEFDLVRRWLTPKSTIGELMMGGVFVAFTLEDTYRPPPEKKVPGETCIPNGRYEIVVTHSPRFNVDMPLLLNVPGFTGVRIHSGNRPKDTEGCILVGRERGVDEIHHSHDAYVAVFHAIQGARARGELVHMNVSVQPEVTNAVA